MSFYEKHCSQVRDKNLVLFLSLTPGQHISKVGTLPSKYFICTEKSGKILFSLLYVFTFRIFA